MYVVIPNNDITIVSKVTGKRYKVQKILIRNNKVYKYLIYNLDELEYWDSSRFEVINKCCEGCCKCML